MRRTRLAKDLQAADDNAEQHGRNVAELIAECEQLKDTNAQIMQRGHIAEGAAAALLSENAELRAELEEANAVVQDILDGSLPDVAEVTNGMVAADEDLLREFLVE
jgi:hypothetical protein